jgi:hypothetical protein
MPIKDGNSIAQEDYTLYCELWEWKIIVMALDHFFEEIVQGNVPLTEAEPWWDRNVIPERVTRFHKNWALLFEGLSRARQRLTESGIPMNYMEIDPNLNMVVERRGAKTVLEWSNDG